MAKKKDDNDTAEITAIDTPPTAFESLEEQSMEKLAEVLSQLEESAGAKVQISRRGPLDTDFGYLTVMPADQFMSGGLEQLKKMYGGGDYRIALKSSQGKYVTQRMFRIDPRFKGVVDEKPTPQPDNDSSPLVAAINKLNTGDKSPELIGRLLDAQNQKSIELMALQRQSSDQMLAMMMKSQENMVLLISKMFDRPAPAAAPVQAGLDFGAAITPILVKMIEQRTSPLDSLKLMQSVKELFERDGEEDPLGGMLKSLAPLAAAFLAQRSAGQGMPMLPPPPPTAVSIEQPAPTSAPPAPTAPGGPVAQAAAPPDPAVMAIAAIRQMLPMLFNAAKHGTDPVSYYDLLLDTASDEQIDALCKILEPDNWLVSVFGDYPDTQTMFAHHPEALAHLDWFRKLRELILHGSEPEPTAEQTEHP